MQRVAIMTFVVIFTIVMIIGLSIAFMAGSR